MKAEAVMATVRARLSLVAAVSFVAVYLCCSLLGLPLTLAPELGAFLWPPSGLLLAVLLRQPKEEAGVWLSLGFAADCVASVLFFDYPVWLAIVIGTGNCLEAGVGAAMLRRWAGGTFQLHDVRSALALTVIGAGGATLLSTLVGGTAITIHTSQNLLASWQLWWTGDAIGILVIAPIALALPVTDWKSTLPQLRGSAVEVAALFSLLLLFAYVVFRHSYPTAFVVFPFVIWAALRHGFVASSVTAAVITLLAVVHAAHGHGPFIGSWSMAVSQILLQAFAISVCLVGLVMSGLAAQALAARRHIEAAYDSARLEVHRKTGLLQAREAQLKQSLEDLSRIDRRKDAFVFTLAHELRGPISTLRNWLSVLESAPSGNNLAAARHAMARQIAHLVYLVDELSDLARIKLGKMAMVADRVALQTVVGDAAASIETLAKNKEQIFAVNLAQEEIIVVGDAVRLTQAIANLLTNASRYTQAGGIISITLVADETNALVTVNDNGPGIPDALLPVLFNMYEQGERRDGPGLGIGLTLVKRIAELHGGDISVRTAQGRGSTFTLRLPRA